MGEPHQSWGSEHGEKLPNKSPWLQEHTTSIESGGGADRGNRCGMQPRTEPADKIRSKPLCGSAAAARRTAAG